MTAEQMKDLFGTGSHPLTGVPLGAAYKVLVDLWDELDLPTHLRAAWQPLIDDARNGPIEDPIYVGYDHTQKLESDDRKDSIAARRACTAPLSSTSTVKP